MSIKTLIFLVRINRALLFIAVGSGVVHLVSWIPAVSRAMADDPSLRITSGVVASAFIVAGCIMASSINKGDPNSGS